LFEALKIILYFKSKSFKHISVFVRLTKYCHSPTPIQPNSTQHKVGVTRLLVSNPPTHHRTAPQTFRPLPDNLGSWFSSNNLILTQIGQIYTHKIGCHKKKTSRQPRKLIFRIQPYLNPTRWNMQKNNSGCHQKKLNWGAIKKWKKIIISKSIDYNHNIILIQPQCKKIT
jgi:hypothetical protein